MYSSTPPETITLIAPSVSPTQVGLVTVSIIVSGKIFSTATLHEFPKKAIVFKLFEIS